MNFKSPALNLYRVKLNIFFLGLFMVQISVANAQESGPNFGIIPAPNHIVKNGGVFTLNQYTSIKADDPANPAVAFLKDHLNRISKLSGSLKSGKLKSQSHATIIKITSQGAEKIPAEGYKLTVTPSEVTLVGKDAGLFYAVQTLIQLLPVQKNGNIAIPCVEIEDRPRFAYRGTMLDVSRHFFTVQEVKKFIDLMALYKLNTFHWHLTDNEGWRIEIKKYPKLTQIGSNRNLTVGNMWPTREKNRDWLDSVNYGGYYTQEEIKEVVKYASNRYITIIPEIEMPGHSGAALLAYPELKCELPKDSKASSVNDITLCPNEETFKFLEDILTEVVALFPSSYIHIGGDEANKAAWKQSPFTQNLIKQLKLKDEHELQSYFIRRMEKFLNSKGRNIIGWEEILEGGLAPNATVMSWKSERGGILSAKQKHDVIMSPAPLGLYFNYYPGKTDMEPVSYGYYNPIEKVYSYNPVPKELTEDEQKYVKGVQASIWTEVISTNAKLEYMAIPRIFALSEVAWTDLQNKNYQDFLERRVPLHLARVDKSGYHYRVPEAFGAPDTTMIGSKFTFKLSPPVPGAKIYYTLNGRIPGDTDFEYTKPLTFYVPASEKRELRTMVITPSGKRSAATSTVMHNAPFLALANHSDLKQGITYKLFKGPFRSLDHMEGTVVVDSGVAKNIITNDFKRKNSSFGVIYEGYIKVEKDGIYNFFLASDDQSQLVIDDESVVENNRNNFPQEKMGAVRLKSGVHKIMLKYFANGGNNILRVAISGPGLSRREIGEENLFY